MTSSTFSHLELHTLMLPAWKAYVKTLSTDDLVAFKHFYESISSDSFEQMKQDGFQIQSVLFPRDKWDSVSACQAWLRAHDFSGTEADTTEDHYRFQQRAPGDFVSIRTICINPGTDTPMENCRVKAIGGPVKESRSADEPDNKLSLQEEVDAALLRIDGVVALFEKLKALRDQDGRPLSAARLEKIRLLSGRLHQLEEVVTIGEADHAAATALF